MIRTSTCIFVTALLFAVVCPAARADTLTFHVALDGKDTWSGKLPAANAAGTDGPFATLTKARDAIRLIKADGGLKGAVRVLVRAGTYYLPETLALSPTDSGTSDFPIAYEGYPNEKVVLSGGRPVDAWKPYRGQIVQCDLKAQGIDKPVFKQLFYNSRRQPLARVPNVDPKHPRSGGWMYVPRTVSIPDYDPAKDDRRWKEPYNATLKKHMTYEPTRVDPRRWAKPELAEVSVFPWQCWNNNLVPIERIDTDKQLITLADKGASYKIIRGNRFFIQNVFEELDAPGEWYLDRESATLYFWPPDDKLAESRVVVPVLNNLITLTGRGAKEPIHNVRIAGFTLGACGSAAVAMQSARDCTVAKSVFHNVGREAVYVGSHSSENRVLGCDITDTGASGIRLRGASETLVSNNHIHHLSVIQRNNPGVSVSGSKNVASHNLIHDCPRSGIVYSGSDNVMEYNRIHHVNFEAADSCIIGMFCGGSYEKAMTRLGNIVRYNYVSDSIGYRMKQPGHWESPCHTYGIRMDDLTSGVTVFGNIIVRTVSGAVQIHSGKDNVLENNIMVDGLSSQVCFSNSLSEFKKIKSDMSGNRFVRNIVSYGNPEARLFAVGGWTERMMAESDYNLFHAHGHVPVIRTLPGCKPADSFSKWKSFGYEKHSLLADPQFVDAANGDYRLRDDSPAWKLGFKRIPVEKIGLHADPDRVSWPVDDQKNIWREELLLETPISP